MNKKILIIVIILLIILLYYYLIYKPKKSRLRQELESAAAAAKAAELAAIEATRKQLEAEALARQKAAELQAKIENWNCYLTSAGNYTIRRTNPITKIPECASKNAESTACYWFANAELPKCKAQVTALAGENGIAPPLKCGASQIIHPTHWCGNSVKLVE